MENQNKLAFNDGWQYSPAPESTDHITIDKQYELFIDGKFSAPEEGRYFETLNPATEEQLSSVALATAGDVDRAVAAARKAYKAVSNAKHVITLEVLAVLQALSFRNGHRLGRGTGRIYEILSKEFVPYDNERIFHDDLVRFRKLLFSSHLFDDLSIYSSPSVEVMGHPQFDAAIGRSHVRSLGKR